MLCGFAHLQSRMSVAELSKSMPGAAGRGEAKGPPVVELRALKKTYFKPDGSIMVEALKGVDLVIERGEYVAIMGSSGSGKSTLMNVLGCLDNPSSGQFLIDGQDVSAFGPDELAQLRRERRMNRQTAEYQRDELLHAAGI